MSEDQKQDNLTEQEDKKEETKENTPEQQEDLSSDTSQDNPEPTEDIEEKKDQDQGEEIKEEASEEVIKKEEVQKDDQTEKSTEEEPEQEQDKESEKNTEKDIEEKKETEEASKKDQLLERPLISPGMVVKVHERIKELDGRGNQKERIQIFEGIVLACKRGREAGATFTVRKIATKGIGVEKIFPLYCPSVEKIEIIRQNKARRAKLYFLRTYKKRLKEIKDKVKQVIKK